VSLVASAVLHYEVSPLSILPTRSLEFKDTDGELSIPIEMLEGPAAPAPPSEPPPPPPAATVAAKDGELAAAHPFDAGAPRPHPRDAGAASDAAPADASPAKDASPSSNEAPSDAGAGGGDGGIGDGVMAGPTLVEIRVNMALVRTNPVGARLGPLLVAIPQWADFLGGTDVDPIKDLDWIWIFGPSLLHTEKDAALLRYGMSDERATKNLAVLAKHDVGGGAYDAGVPGVRAWRARADRAWRVFLLPRPHLAAMVPPDFAHVAAAAFSRREPRPPTAPNEAVRVMVKNPSHPMPFLPTSLSEMRLWAVPRAGGGADVYVEADAPDDGAAQVAAKQVRKVIQDMNSFGVKIVTRGILNDVDVRSDGSLVKVHAEVSRDQLEALYDVLSAMLGVNEPEGAPSSLPSGSGGTPGLPVTPRPPRAPGSAR
jgi:hypothetical protein